MKQITSIVILLLCSQFAIASQTEYWICNPDHWVNLRNNGADINPGNEPSFMMTIKGNLLTTSGKESWLNDGEFTLESELTLANQVFIKAQASYGSLFVLNKTEGEFVHASAHPSVATSMAGKCFQFIPD